MDSKKTKWVAVEMIVFGFGLTILQIVGLIAEKLLPANPYDFPETQVTFLRVLETFFSYLPGICGVLGIYWGFRIDRDKCEYRFQKIVYFLEMFFASAFLYTFSDWIETRIITWIVQNYSSPTPYLLLSLLNILFCIVGFAVPLLGGLAGSFGGGIAAALGSGYSLLPDLDFLYPGLSVYRIVNASLTAFCAAMTVYLFSKSAKKHWSKFLGILLAGANASACQVLLNLIILPLIPPYEVRYSWEGMYSYIILCTLTIGIDAFLAIRVIRKNQFAQRQLVLNAAHEAGTLQNTESETPRPGAPLSGTEPLVSQQPLPNTEPPASQPLSYVTQQPSPNTSSPVSQPLSSAGDTPAQKIRFCRHCGFELVEGSIYCSRCGAAVGLGNDSAGDR